MRYNLCIFILLHSMTVYASQETKKTLETITEEVITNIDETNDRGETPLMRAAGSGDFEMTSLLLQYNANPYAQDNSGRTPLIWATIGNFTEIIRLLLEYNAGINAVDTQKKSALIYATTHEDGKCLDLLLKKGADHTLQDKRGKVALMHAVEWMTQMNVVKLLEQEPFIATDINGRSIEDHIKRHTRIVNKQKELLIEQETQQSKEVKKSHEDLPDILYSNDTESLQNYLENGGTIKSNELGYIPLHGAASRGSLHMIDILLNNKSDINEQDSLGNTAIMQAIYWNKNNACIILLHRGADVSIKNNNNCTAYDLMTQKKQYVLAERIKNFEQKKKEKK